MVQKEVKKKTKIFRAVAVLSAIVMVTMVSLLDHPALNGPEAFLFDKSKNLRVIPVSLAIVNNSTLDHYGKSKASAYDQTVWQEAYVFSLTPDGGFTLKGTVTHMIQHC